MGTERWEREQRLSAHEENRRREGRAAGLALALILTALVCGCAWKVAAWKECRDAGFSVLYCARR